MLLVIDVGNSNSVLGLYDGDELRAQWRLVTTIHRTADELGVVLSMLFQQAGIAPESVDACCISSVVPPMDSTLLDVARNIFHVEPLIVGPGVKTGLIIQVDNPKEVGADRIVNAVGAIESYPGALIVIDFGTATTFDAITDKGEYRGGIIVPGIQISADALFEKCAKLPRVDIGRPANVIGRNTVAHIQSGLTFGYADLVDGLIERMKKEMGGAPTVVATGGLAPAIAELAQRIDHVDPHLTLRGLKAIYAKNARAAV